MADETESLCPSVQGQLPQQHCTSASRERPILWSMTDVHTSAAHAFRSSSVRRARRRRKEGRMGSRAVRTSPCLSQRRAPDTRLHTGQSPWVGSTPRGLSAGCQEPSPYFLPVLSTWTSVCLSSYRFLPSALSCFCCACAERRLELRIYRRGGGV